MHQPQLWESPVESYASCDSELSCMVDPHDCCHCHSLDQWLKVCVCVSKRAIDRVSVQLAVKRDSTTVAASCDTAASCEQRVYGAALTSGCGDPDLLSKSIGWFMFDRCAINQAHSTTAMML